MPRFNEPHPSPPRASCDQALDRLELYLDGLDGTDGADEGLPALTGGERATLEDHLTRCPTCSRELARAQRIRDGLRALPAVPFELPDPGRTEDLGTPGRLLPGPWLRWAVPLAAAAMLVIAVLVALPRGPARGPMTVETPTGPETVSAEELARAELEARYALARLAEVTRKTEREIRDDVLARHVVAPVQRELLRSFGVAPDLDPKPTPEEPSSL